MPASLELENPSFRYGKGKNSISINDKISVHFQGLNLDLDSLEGVGKQPKNRLEKSALNCSSLDRK
jgi:hypothetical protein